MYTKIIGTGSYLPEQVRTNADLDRKSTRLNSSHLNPDQYNGACLLGLRGTVIKSHGAANQRAFAVAIEQAVQAVQRQVPQRIAARLKSVYPAGFELLEDERGKKPNHR